MSLNSLVTMLLRRDWAYQCVHRVVECNSDSSSIIKMITPFILIKLCCVQVLGSCMYVSKKKNRCMWNYTYNYASDFYYLCFAQHFLACLCCQVWVPDSSYGRLYVMHAKQNIPSEIRIMYTYEGSLHSLHNAPCL